MDRLFLAILNMSLTGAFVIGAICLIRVPLKKAPKIISYWLWAVAGFRLVVPYSVESIYSLVPFKARAIPLDIAMQPQPRIDSGIPFLNSAVSSSLPATMPTASVNPLQIWITLLAWVWVIGIAILFLYGAKSYVGLKKKMKSAAHCQANIYEAEQITSPFVLGIFRPRIYLPTGLSEPEKGHVTLHEQTHIRRHDPIIKAVAYGILCVHWFNPMAWIAFTLMGADMEMSCDERVLKEMGSEMKKEYSLSLLRLATEQHIGSSHPLAFGSGGVKARIVHVLNFEKPSRLILVAAATLAIVLGAGFAMNRKTPATEPPELYTGTHTLENMDALSGLQTPYVGNNSAVGAIIAALPPLGKGYVQQYFSVGDDYGSGYAPFTLTIYYEPADPNGIDTSNVTVDPVNAILPFALIDNLEEVSFAFRATTSSDGLDKAAYISRIGFSKSEITAYLENLGLGLEDVLNGRLDPLQETLGFDPLPETHGQPFATVYEPREWLDYFYSDAMPWDKRFDLELPEYPGTTFRWEPLNVTAITQGGEKTLFSGMPIWNVYLTDLTGDGLPELCATISIGSGIVDNRVVVYDYATDMLYELSDRAKYDYSLSLEGGQLLVAKTPYNTTGAPLAVGTLAVVDHGLIATYMD